jgi:putative spermidine/putrescine transport system substrate-binding protein
MIRRVSRRSFIATSAAAAATLASPRPLRAATSQIVVTDPGGEWQKAAAEAFYVPFEKETGVKVSYAARPHMSMGRLKAMVEAGNTEWDVTVFVKGLVPLVVKQGLLEPIDYGKIDKSQFIPGAITPHFLADHITGSMVTYSAKKFPTDGPKSWADFWNADKFPGRRGMFRGTFQTLEIALLADGVAPDKLYPLDMDRAFKSLDRVKPHIQVWWTSAAQSVQLVLDGEVDIISGWANRMYAAIAQGAPYRRVWNQAIMGFEGWAVPRGTKNRAAAMEFLAFAAKPDRQAAFARSQPVGPTNKGAYAFIPDQIARELPTYPANLPGLVYEDADWIGANQAKIEERWAQWIAG